jgi:hypothetical protein
MKKYFRLAAVFVMAQAFLMHPRQLTKCRGESFSLREKVA